jgi:hypothetical protein
MQYRTTQVSQPPGTLGLGVIDTHLAAEASLGWDLHSTSSTSQPAPGGGIEVIHTFVWARR